MGIDVSYSEETASWSMPPIDVSRIENEFGGVRRNLVDDLPQLVKTAVI
jgi:hypothetical protein